MRRVSDLSGCGILFNTMSTQAELIVKLQEQVEVVDALVNAKNEKIDQLHAECRKYRLALNRIAHPNSYQIIPGHEVEIASRALLIGGTASPVPEAAKASETANYDN